MSLRLTSLSRGARQRALAAKQATNSIPIVAVVMADPVGDGLVTSLARPAGNITGTTFVGPELVSKRLQLLKEIIPGLSRVAALWHPHAYSERTMANMSKEIETAARTLGIQLQFVPADSPGEVANAFSTIIKERPDAFILMPSPMLFGEYTHFGFRDEQSASSNVSSEGACRSGRPHVLWRKFE